MFERYSRSSKRSRERERESERECGARAMASKREEEEQLAFSAAYEDDTPTPSGWKRKLVPRIGKGLIPARTDVIFITPSGEEFTSRAQLQRYLKANKGSPSISEFIWIVDELPKRSTRSKSTGVVEVEKVELPLKIASKRKPAPKVPIEEVELSKRQRTEKKQKPVVEQTLVKDKRTKQVVHAVSPSKGKSEGEAFTGSSPVSPKRKRSVKTVKKTSRVPAEMKSVETNGEADLGKKNEVVVEAVEEPISQKASKKKPTKARTARGGRNKGTKPVVADMKEDAEGENGVDESSPPEEITKVESDAELGDKDNHHAEKDSLEVEASNTENEAVIDQENHLAESKF